MSEEMSYGQNIPWHDSTKWKAGEWYPRPCGFLERDYPGNPILNGYGIFMLDPLIKEGDPLFGDIVPVEEWPKDYSFSKAIKICEIQNERRMIG